MLKTTIILTALCWSVGTAAGEGPELFSVWAEAGPEFPAVPEGWRGEAKPEVPSGFAAADRDRERDFVLFARDYARAVGPYAQPDGDERIGELRAFVTPGEYEPISFVVHALEDIQDLRLAVGDLVAASGRISSAQIDPRWVRYVRQVTDKQKKLYRDVPFLLERRAGISLKCGTNAQAWLTLKVPDASSAGLYKGTVTLTADGRSAAIPLLVRVLPFVLPEASAEMTMSLRPPKDEDALRACLIDLREHGIRGGQTLASAEVVSRDRKFGDDDVKASVRSTERMMRAYREAFGRLPSRFRFGVGHQIIYYWNHQKFWFSFWPYDKEERTADDAEDEAEALMLQQEAQMKSDFVEAGELMAGLAQKNGWSEAWAYVIDEPGGHGHIADAVYWNTYLKQRVPNLKTHVCIGGGIAMGLDEIGQLTPAIDFFLLNRFSRPIYDSLAQNDRAESYGVYNGGSSSERIGQFVRDRFFYGFYGFKTGAREVMQWVYQFGKPFREPFRGNHGYSYPTPEGPLPSIALECLREGIDDYRYAQLLHSMIAAARKSQEAAARSAAEKAAAELNWLMAQVTLRYQAAHGREPAPAPAEIQRWRWLVASQILTLARHVDAAGIKSAPAPPPTRWPARETASSLVLGEELVPKGDFEGDGEKAWGPWAAQFWSGKGEAALDATQAHSGRQSVRITNTENAGPEKPAVSVLLWASWRMPGGRPSIQKILEAGNSYLLSAWVRGEGGFLPTLRIATKGGKVKTRTVLGEKEGEWQELKLIADVARSAQVSYLCVWVMGTPATVWVDDLSFREVKRPELALHLERRIFTDEDRSAAIRIEAAEGVEEVQVTLIDSVTEKARGLTFPTSSHFVIAEEAGMRAATVAKSREFTVTFDPSGFGVGEHKVKVERIGGSAQPLEATFRRISGPFGGAEGDPSGSSAAVMP